MNFVSLTAQAGHKFRLNLDHVVLFEPDMDGSTRIELRNGDVIWCVETVEQLDKFVNGMAAFVNHVPGVTFQQWAEEQLGE